MRECEKYLEYISCSIDGELSAEEQALLDAHLLTCPDCAQVQEAFTAISDNMRGGMAEPPKALARNVMFRVSARGKPRRRNRIGGMVALAACMALVIFAGVRFLPAVNGSDSGASNDEAGEQLEGYSEPRSGAVASDSDLASYSPNDFTAVTAEEDLADGLDAGEADLAEYSEAELIAYFLTSDGAYAEGAISAMYSRFLETPGNVLAAMSGLEEENLYTVAFHLSAYPYGGEAEEITAFSTLLDSLWETVEDEAERSVVSLIADCFNEYAVDTKAG